MCVYICECVCLVFGASRISATVTHFKSLWLPITASICNEYSLILNVHRRVQRSKRIHRVCRLDLSLCWASGQYQGQRSVNQPSNLEMTFLGLKADIQHTFSRGSWPIYGLYSLCSFQEIRKPDCVSYRRPYCIPLTTSCLKATHMSALTSSDFV